MPKKTFQNLPEAKQERFIGACLSEFSLHDYDTASITQIVRRLDIAKGSVYQYFKNKKDLWLYLRQYAEQRRLTYLKDVFRSNYDNFSDYFREIQQQQITFNLNEPETARFLFRATFLEGSADLHDQIVSWKRHQIQIYEKLVEAEKLMGGLDKSLRTQTVAMFLQSISFTIRDFLVDAEVSRKFEPDVAPPPVEEKSVFKRIFGGKSASEKEKNTTQAADELIDDLLVMLTKSIQV